MHVYESVMVILVVVMTLARKNSVYPIQSSRNAAIYNCAAENIISWIVATEQHRDINDGLAFKKQIKYLENAILISMVSKLKKK